MQRDSNEETRTFVPEDLIADPTASYFPGVSKRGTTEDTLPTVNPVDEASSGTSSQTSSPEPVRSQRASESEDIVLRRIVGRGGCGEVYEALQTSLGRIIAVKCIRRELRQSEAAREYEEDFQREAFITARLDHPNIIPVYQLGFSQEGDPQLAMKLARGTPWNILLKMERENLDLETYLNRHIPILISIGQAVAFAHSRDIVHRDLKPAQVVIGEYGEVLLMDWGLAIYLGDEDARQERSTHSIPLAKLPTMASASSPAGTPAYMSPEQTEPTARNVGTWTDVYLLGGILYALLTGTPPHIAESATKSFLRASIGEIEPPSVRAPNIKIPAELEQLALKCLQRQPSDRISGATEFVQALQDYLSGASRRRESAALAGELSDRIEKQPAEYRELNECDNLLDRVERLWPANPERETLHERLHQLFANAALTNGDLNLARLKAEQIENDQQREELLSIVEDRRKKNARAHFQRRVFLATSLMLVAIVVIVGFFLQSTAAREELAAREADHQREVAQLFKDINRLRREEDALAAEIARAIPLPDTLQQESTASSPERPAELLARRAELRALREKLSSEVNEELEAEPVPLVLAEANLLIDQASTTEEFLAAFDRYQMASEIAPAREEPLLGMGIAAARAGFLTSSTIYLEQAVGKVAEAKGVKHPDYANALSLQAAANLALDEESDDYVELYRQSLNVLEPLWAETSLAIAERLDELSYHDEALKYTSPTLQLVRKHYGENSPEVIPYLRKHTGLLMRRGADEEAEIHANEILALETELYGEESLEVADALVTLGSLKQVQGQFEKSLEYLESAKDLYEKLLDNPEDELIARTLANLAKTQRFMGRFNESLDNVKRVTEIRSKLYGENHPNVASIYLDLALANKAAGNFVEAIEDGKRAVGIFERAYGLDNPKTAIAYQSLSDFYKQSGKYLDAAEYGMKAWEIVEKRLPEDHPMRLVVSYGVAVSLSNSGQITKAVNYFQHAMDAHRNAFGENDFRTAIVTSTAGDNYFNLGEFEKALELQQWAHDTMLTQFGTNHPYIATSKNSVANTLTNLGRMEEAIAIQRDAIQIAANTYGVEHPVYLRFESNYIEMLKIAGRFSEGIVWSLPLCYRSFADAEKLDHWSFDVFINLADLMVTSGESIPETLPAVLSIWKRTQGNLGQYHKSTAAALHSAFLVAASDNDPASSRELYAAILIKMDNIRLDITKPSDEPDDSNVAWMIVASRASQEVMKATMLHALLPDQPEYAEACFHRGAAYMKLVKTFAPHMNTAAFAERALERFQYSDYFENLPEPDPETFFDHGSARTALVAEYVNAAGPSVDPEDVFPEFDRELIDKLVTDSPEEHLNFIREFLEREMEERGIPIPEISDAE